MKKNNNDELYNKIVNDEKKMEEIAKKLCYILAIFGALAIFSVIYSIFVNGFPRMPDQIIHILGD